MKVFILCKDRGVSDLTVQVFDVTLGESEANSWLKEAEDNIVLEGEVSVTVDETAPRTSE